MIASASASLPTAPSNTRSPTTQLGVPGKPMFSARNTLFCNCPSKSPRAMAARAAARSTPALLAAAVDRRRRSARQTQTSRRGRRRTCPAAAAASAIRAASALPWRQDRIFADHHPQIRIGGNQRGHVGHALAAIAAGVIGEFDQGDAALRIAEHGAGEWGFQIDAQGGDPRHHLAALQHFHRLWQHFGVGQQVIAGRRGRPDPKTARRRPRQSRRAGRRQW